MDESVGASLLSSMSLSSVAHLLNNQRHFPAIDVASCKREGTSYIILQPTFVPPTCSGRTDLDRSVLNDWLVSTRHDAEGQTTNNRHYEQRRTNQECNILKCEDDRVDLDVVIQEFYSTVREIHMLMRRAERGEDIKTPAPSSWQKSSSFLKDSESAASSGITTTTTQPPLSAAAAAAGTTTTTMPVPPPSSTGHSSRSTTAAAAAANAVREVLTPAQRGAMSSIASAMIMRLYGGKGAMMVQVFLDNPAIAGPVIIERIKERVVQLLKTRRMLSRGWRTIHEIRFKQVADSYTVISRKCAERWNLMPNALLDKIYQQGPAALDESPIRKHMNDVEIHGDIMRLLVFAPSRRSNPTTSLPFSEDYERAMQGSYFMREPESRVRVFFDSFLRVFFSAPSTVFHGSSTMALFFQLYTMLYKLLQLSKSIAVVTNLNGWNQVLYSTAGSKWLRHCHPLAPLSGGGKDLHSSYSYYVRFLNLVVSRKVGVVPQKAFEDDTQLLFGQNGAAWHLYSVPMLIGLLSRLLDDILRTEPCLELISLFLEKKKEQALQRSSVPEQADEDAAQRIVGLDSQLFRICFDENEEIGISPVERSHEFHTGKPHSDFDTADKNTTNDDHHALSSTTTASLCYDGFTRFKEEDFSSVSGSGENVFLVRSRVNHQDTSSSPTPMQQQQPSQTMVSHRGLQEQVRGIDSALKFVSGTEDIMFWN